MNIDHISDRELIGFSDCEVEPDRASAIEMHLKGCAQCTARWAALSSGAQAYEQFHEEVLKPALALPQAEWPDLRLARAAPPRRNFSMRPAVWSAVGLAAACLALGVIHVRNATQRRHFTEILARASNAPAPIHRRIRVSVGGESWSRPALLSHLSEPAGLQHVEALFVRANYSWGDPLSARSFAVWRSSLREKRDHVTYVPGPDRLNRLYRVETETGDGALRDASLTLRSEDMAAVDGAFEFDNHERVTMADAGQDSNALPSSQIRPIPREENELPHPTEHPVNATDELRVLAALDQIGADVDEPLNVEPDATNHYLVVSGMGMPTAREQQIRAAVATIPNVVVRFSSAQAPASRAQFPAGPHAVPAGDNGALRRLLEERAGGAVQLQATTDQALDASNSLLARAHALAVLAQKFPPNVEMNFSKANHDVLSRLRRKHVIAIEQTALNLQAALTPLLPGPATDRDRSAETGTPFDASWQSGAAELFDRVRALDQSVTNLLGANYSFEAAQDVLNRLPGNLEQVEALARRQARAE